MRNSVVYALTVILVWSALALLFVQPGTPGARSGSVSSEDRSAVLEAALTSSAAETAELSVPNPRTGYDTAFRLPVLLEGRTVSMDLQRYLTGVLLAELPDSFSDEARKAQAAACRTYALRSYTHRRHKDAAVCTSAACCQGWRDPDSVPPEARARAEAAVRATDGLVIRYEGELIDATFFSCSGGHTEDAAAVWGNDMPYLRAVESPGEESAPRFSAERRIPLEEFRTVLEEADPALALDGPAENWIGAVTYTSGGGVDEIELCGRLFSGKQLRKSFDLCSTAFTLRFEGEEAVFSTCGFGHRVGMSQYGAEAMARAGNDYLTILKWYYTGVTIEAAE